MLDRLVPVLLGAALLFCWKSTWARHGASVEV